MGKVFWIVNENGDNVRISNSVGDDGCNYEINEKEGSAIQIGKEGNEERFISGEFDLHYKPFLY